MSDHSQCAAKYHLDCLGLCADPAKCQIAAVLILNFNTLYLSIDLDIALSQQFS